MKTILLTAISALLAFSAPAYAQITFTDTDFQPVIGQVRNAETFTASPTPFLGESNAIQALAAQSGANQTYDLRPFTYDPPDPATTEVLAFSPSGPGGTIAAYAGADYIELASVAANPSFPADAHGFYSVSSTALLFHGALISGFSQSENVPPEVLYALPMSFGDTWTSTHTETTTTPTGTFVQTVTLTQTVDGWGTLITPAGSADCLRISVTREVSSNGMVIVTDESIDFITRDGLTAHMGFDEAFQIWGSVSYTVESLSGGSEVSDGVLFVVDDVASLDAADQVAHDQMIDLGLMVEVLDDNTVTTDDGAGRDLIVVSSSIDAQALAADWRETAVPLLTWDAPLYPMLDFTGSQSSIDYGTTTTSQQLWLDDTGHPIAQGISGGIEVYSTTSPMAFGIPSDQAVVLGRFEGSTGNPVLYTYEQGAAMVSVPAPARRAGFFFAEDGGAQAATDGLILFNNTVLWLLGREGEIADAVSNEAPDEIGGVRVGQNYPNPFTGETWIPVQLSRPTQVALEVFDLLGRRVATVADATYPAGAHQIRFDRGDLPNGHYFYRAKIGDVVVSRPMMLTR